LIRLGDGDGLVKPGRGIGAAALVKKSEQGAAFDDTSLFPFCLGANVDHRHPAFDQFVELGIVDVNYFGLRQRSEKAKDKEGNQAAHGGLAHGLIRMG
jgi:hypothetical protein